MLAVLLVLCWWLIRPQQSPPAAGDASEPGAARLAISVAAAAPAAAVQPAERSAATATGTGLQRTHPFEVELVVHALDMFGLPVAGFVPEIAPEGGTAVPLAAATDATGRVTMRLPARQPRVALEVIDPRGHRHAVSPGASVPTVITLLVPATATSVDLTETDATRGDAAGPRWTGIEPDGEPTHPVVHGAGLHPDVRLPQSGLALVPGRTPVLWHRACSSLEPVGMHMEDRERNLVGKVVDADGAPAANVPVVLVSQQRITARTWTDDDGGFGFWQAWSNGARLRAGGDWRGRAEAELTADQAATITLRLDPGRMVRGTVRTRDGIPLEAFVEWRAADGTWTAGTTTDVDGSFALANLPPGSGRLLAFAIPPGPPLPIASCDDAVAGGPPVALTAAHRQGCTARLQRIMGLAEDIAIELWVRQEASATAFVAELPTDADEPWQLAHLAAGWHTFALRIPGCGTIELGRLLLTGADDVDLGTWLPLPAAGGTVRLCAAADGDDPARTYELVQERPDFDVRILPPPPLGAPVLLPAGNYWLLAAPRSGDGEARAVRFALGGGEQLVVRLPE